MRNILIIILLICSVFETSAQTVLFSEDFEDENVGDVTGTSAEGIGWNATKQMIPPLI